MMVAILAECQRLEQNWTVIQKSHSMVDIREQLSVDGPLVPHQDEHLTDKGTILQSTPR